MAFDMDDEELEYTRRMKGLDKKEFNPSNTYINKYILIEMVNRNLRKDNIVDHYGFLYDFDGCQQLAKELVNLLDLNNYRKESSNE